MCYCSALDCNVLTYGRALEPGLGFFIFFFKWLNSELSTQFSLGIEFVYIIPQLGSCM